MLLFSISLTCNIRFQFQFATFDAWLESQNVKVKLLGKCPKYTMYIHVVNICMYACVYVFICVLDVILFYVCIYRIKIKRRQQFIWHLYYAWPVYLPRLHGCRVSRTLRIPYWCVPMRACMCVCKCLCCGFVVYFNVGQLMSSVITRIDHVPPHVGCSLLIFMINLAAQWGDTVCTHDRLPLPDLPCSPFT